MPVLKAEQGNHGGGKIVLLWIGIGFLHVCVPIPGPILTTNPTAQYFRVY
jgi:hypothetical protein